MSHTYLSNDCKPVFDKEEEKSKEVSRGAAENAEKRRRENRLPLFFSAFSAAPRETSS
jgi:hypothetical protein